MYVMPIVDILANVIVKNELLSFLKGFFSYNQIFITPDDVIFHDMLGHFMEVYIDNIVVKSKKVDDHLEHLRKSS